MPCASIPHSAAPGNRKTYPVSEQPTEQVSNRVRHPLHSRIIAQRASITASSPPSPTAHRGQRNRAPLHQWLCLCQPSLFQRLLASTAVTHSDGRIPAQGVACFRSPQYLTAAWTAAIFLRLMFSVPVQRHLRLILRANLVRPISAVGKGEGTAAVPIAHTLPASSTPVTVACDPTWICT